MKRRTVSTISHQTTSQPIARLPADHSTLPLALYVPTLEYCDVMWLCAYVPNSINSRCGYIDRLLRHKIRGNTLCIAQRGHSTLIAI